MEWVTGWLRLTEGTKRSLLKYTGLGVSMLLVIVILSLLSLGLVRSIVSKSSLTNPARPEEIIRILVEKTNPLKRLDLINEIDLSNIDFPFRVYLVDRKNKILSPYSELQKVGFLKPEVFNREGAQMERSAPFFPMRLFGRPPRPPHHLRKIRYKMEGEEDQYLIFVPQKKVGAQDRSFFLGFAALIVSLFLGIVCTIGFMILIFRKQTRSMDRIIERLKKGDLKARVEIGKFDDFSQSKIKFNQMAKEIESLVNSLRLAESSRKTLMSELAHDLRTPITSLKSILEIIKDRRDVLNKDKVDSLLDTSVKEVDYFSLLVDDLLFLGQVNLPQYKKEDVKIRVKELLDLELSDIASRYSKLEFKIECEDETFVNMDQKLFTRLLRNALENACSFASALIIVRVVKNDDKSVRITLEDDGPGLSEENLNNFGQKKFSREMRHFENNRISIGLGSVIMKSIVESYGGSLNIENKSDGLKVTGAVLTILLSHN